jgi:hypothetical protein
MNKHSNKLRLSKTILWLDSTPAKGIITTDFIYDDQKRLVELTLFNGDSVAGEIKNRVVWRYQLFYKGNDKNPYRSVSPFYASLNTELYHFYNADGILIRDSTVLPPMYHGVHTKNYIYDTGAGKIIGVNLYNFERSIKFGRSTEILYDSFTVTDHNLTCAFINSDFKKQVTGYRISYDNKVNPVSKLNIAHATMVTGPLGANYYLAAGFCKNNVIESVMGTSNGPGDFTPTKSFNKYKYDYNRNGLPEVCYYTNEDFSGKIKYYYIE